MARFFDKHYPLIPWVTWVGKAVDTRWGYEGETLYWSAGVNWREWGVVRSANTPEQAVLLALFSVVGFRLTGNGYFPDRRI